MNGGKSFYGKFSVGIFLRFLIKKKRTVCRNIYWRKEMKEVFQDLIFTY